ncbi:MAG: putative oxidoreductase [Parcubacteria group bacterium Gr01-1014_3]|nr:MAG: putative oxidoreductase [Parcubacteria group bacterium Gr01-1014_3]
MTDELRKVVQGEILEDEKSRIHYSRDASLFEVKPKAIIFPKDVEDLKSLVSYVSREKKDHPELALTARSAGTDMTGGPLSESMVLDFTKHFNHIKEVGDGYAISESGVFYRDFEKETLARGWFLPSYPASREICAIGGMVNNNSGGEKSLIYGKTQNYVEELKMVLRDGNEHTIKKISKVELNQKRRQEDFESGIYRQIHDLLEKNQEVIKNSRPRVSKNSSGYNIWDVWDGEHFDLTKLFVGAQGTLGIMTEVKLRLVRPKSNSGMLVVFLKDLLKLDQIVNVVMPLKPSSFEAFDNHTLKLALRFFRGFIKLLGAGNAINLAWQFLPEFFMLLTTGLPKLVLLVEFEGDSADEVVQKVSGLKKTLDKMKIKSRLATTAQEAKKYWAIRRESFNLLRQKIKGKQTAPFVDDLIVQPDQLDEFLPKLYEILDRYQMLYTIAGHIGDGNLHIIPLMVLADEKERAKIAPVMDEVYKLTLSFGGSITAEHNDGLIRSPYLSMMYGEEVYKIFESIKNIFDPDRIFNPGKKVGASLEYALAHLKKS